MRKATRSDLERLVTATRETWGLTVEVNSWAPGDRYGRRYSIDISGTGEQTGRTTTLHALGVREACDILQAFRSGLWVGGAPTVSEV